MPETGREAVKLKRMRRRRWIETWALCAALVASGTASAQQADRTPKALEDVGVEEHLDVAIPGDLEFVDDAGKTVRLADYLDGERPVILTLNYYKCPMLCGLQLKGLLEGLQELKWTAGEQFEIVTVSINPLETPSLARLKKQSYLKEYGRPPAAAGWHFLTGKEAAIRKLADTVGFTYTYDPERKEYAHAAALMVLTPEGHVARYLYGISYEASKLRLALLEASEGEIGSPWDRVILYCYHYDPSSRSYSPVAMNIMRVGGVATVAILGLTLGTFWFRESRRRKSPTKESPEA